MSKEAVLPVLMRPGEIITLKEAVYRTGKNEKTIRRWCKEDGIGRRSSPGAPWEISAVALEAKCYGDAEAIEELRRISFGRIISARYAIAIGAQP